MSQKSVDVTVTPGVAISVNDEKVKVKRNLDTVSWKATTNNQEFSIIFPPGEPPVTCGWQGNRWVCEAGPFTNNSGSSRTFKYDVAASGTPTLDPEVEIQT
jgi:hypothetical protein